MTKSIRRTLLLWLLIPLLSLFSIGTLVVYQLALTYSEDAHDRALLESANDIEQLAHVSLNNSGKIELPGMVRDILLADQYDKAFFSLLDEQGTLMSGDGKLPLPTEDADVEDEATYYDTHIQGQAVRAILTELHFDAAGKPHTWRVLVGETRNKRKMLARDILTGFVAPQAFIILLATGLVMLGISRGLAPFESLRSAVAAREPDDTQPLDTQAAPVEVRPLLGEINNLLRRLQAVFESHKRFTADAAHQLRTPLAGLAAQTDLALSQDNPPQTGHALDRIKEVSTRLNHAVNQLLSLARNEPGAERSLQLEIIDLNELGRQVTVTWVERAMEHGIDLGFEGAGCMQPMRGDPTKLRELLDNLIDNALRYCPLGSQVTVRVEPDCAICVEDNGPGIPLEESERIFDRFHRLSGSTAEGNGLGLAIVKEIAEIHNGSIAVEQGANGQGARFRARFPTIGTAL